MTFAEILKGLNDGGFAFVGMLLITAILFGGARLAGWLINTGWPGFLRTMEQASMDNKAAAITFQNVADKAMAQSEKIIERQSAIQDVLMSQTASIAESHKTIVTKLDTVIDKIGGKQ